MANKKSATQSTKKVVKENAVADLRTKSEEDLQKVLGKARADLLELQKGLKANELANPGAVRKARRRVAKILTIIGEKSRSNNNEEKETK